MVLRIHQLLKKFTLEIKNLVLFALDLLNSHVMDRIWNDHRFPGLASSMTEQSP